MVRAALLNPTHFAAVSMQPLSVLSSERTRYDATLFYHLLWELVPIYLLRLAKVVFKKIKENADLTRTLCGIAVCSVARFRMTCSRNKTPNERRKRSTSFEATTRAFLSSVARRAPKALNYGNCVSPRIHQAVYPSAKKLLVHNFRLCTIVL